MVVRLQEHLQKIESEIENQRTSYNDDYDKKRKNIETHQEKLSETLHQFEDEIKKVKSSYPHFPLNAQNTSHRRDPVVLDLSNL